MDIRKLQRAIVDGLEDVKGQNIVVFNTEHLSPLFERVIIASGTSNRQTRALAASVRDAVKGRGLGAPRVEGEDNGEWIIVDCGAAVVHLMQPGIRDYYHLEEIWGEKPVRMKIEGAPRRLAKASPEDDAQGEGDAAPAPRVRRSRGAADADGEVASADDGGAGRPARKAAAKKVPARKAPASKAAAGKKAASAGVSRTEGTKSAPAAAKKAGAARKRAGVSESVARQAAIWAAPPAKAALRSGATDGAAPVRKTPARKTAARKTAGSASPAGKTAAGKTAAGPAAGKKAVAARKTPARKTTAARSRGGE